MDLKNIFRKEVKKNNLLIFLIIVFVGTVFSALIPPLQSPDEPDHLKRAYLLSKGQFLLSTPEGKLSGGNIDSGLIAYFSIYNGLPHHPGKKLSSEEELELSNIVWTGERVFSPAPGTGYYFPLAYAPQALAMSIGEISGLTVHDSYRLARAFVLIFSAILIVAANSITPINAFVIGLLVIPMSIFQLSSASLDAFTTSMTLLCLALFIRGGTVEKEFPAWMSYLLGGCLLLLAGSRNHLSPLLLLPLVISVLRKSRRDFWLFLVAAVIFLVWSYVSIRGTFGHTYKGTLGYEEVATGHSVAQYISFYAQKPFMLWQVIADTILANYGQYKKSFIGILGWQDASFNQEFYAVVSSCLLGLAVLSINLKDIYKSWKARLTLVVLSLLAVFLIFLALLVSWNTLPTNIVEGVQGRYFIGPMIVFGYALSGGSGSLSNKWGKYGYIPLLILGFMVAFSMPKLLVSRYYQPAYEIAEARLTVKPGKAINRSAPYVLSFLEIHKRENRKLKRIGIMLWNRNKHASGELELMLNGQDNNVFVRRFLLKEVTNNIYHYFEIDSKSYKYGELISFTDEEAGVYEGYGDHGIKSCVVYEYVDGKKRYTPGCPIF